MVDTGGQEPEDDNEDINIPEQVESCFEILFEGLQDGVGWCCAIFSTIYDL